MITLLQLCIWNIVKSNWRVGGMTRSQYFQFWTINRYLHYYHNLKTVEKWRQIYVIIPPFVYSLIPGKCGWILKGMFLKLIIQISFSLWNCPEVKPQNITNEKPTLVKVMAWCRQATSQYLNPSWSSSIATWRHLPTKIYFFNGLRLPSFELIEWLFLAIGRVKKHFLLKHSFKTDAFTYKQPYRRRNGIRNWPMWSLTDINIEPFIKRKSFQSG